MNGHKLFLILLFACATIFPIRAQGTICKSAFVQENSQQNTDSATKPNTKPALETEIAFELTTPVMTNESPGAGKRVRQTAPEYRGTGVHHALYLPTNWKRNSRFPVIVEYTGNQWAPGNSTGKVKDANLGFGLSGGKDFIWVVMPCVDSANKKNAIRWWGDREATIEYCKQNLPRICKQFGGDPENVLLCGFSRGAIAAGYIGLADDDIAKLWKAVFTHDHFDGERKWNYPKSDRASALKRLSRLNGRPVLVSGTNAKKTWDSFLAKHATLAKFKVLNVPVKEIIAIPKGKVIHQHTDLWMHQPSSFREQARTWLYENQSAIELSR